MALLRASQGAGHGAELFPVLLGRIVLLPVMPQEPVVIAVKKPVECETDATVPQVPVVIVRKSPWLSPWRSSPSMRRGARGGVVPAGPGRGHARPGI